MIDQALHLYQAIGSSIFFFGPTP